jgi:hypothetical protein
MIGAPYYFDSDRIRNQFLVRLVNKRSVPVALFVSVKGLPEGASAQGIEAPVNIAPMGEEVRPLIVMEPRGRFAAPFTFEVEAADSAGHFRLVRSMEFIGPDVPPGSPGPGKPPDAAGNGGAGAPNSR